ncbi:MAG: hypothetical protein BIFFINMI_00676 [Phycisphaerae bacterium]|nr:hypothetical protein [Phycisphaerae bacterium]
MFANVQGVVGGPEVADQDPVEGLGEEPAQGLPAAVTVADLQADRIPAIYGDATRAEVLELAGAAEASCIVITMPDGQASISATRAARSVAPSARILTRANFDSLVDRVQAAGADVAIGQETATARVLEAALAELLPGGAVKAPPAPAE